MGRDVHRDQGPSRLHRAGAVHLSALLARRHRARRAGALPPAARHVAPRRHPRHARLHRLLGADARAADDLRVALRVHHWPVRRARSVCGLGALPRAHRQARVARLRARGDRHDDAHWRHRRARPSWGDALTFVCAICFAMHVVLSAKYSAGTSALALAAVQVLVVGVAAAPVSAFAPRPHIDAYVATVIVFTAIVTTALAFVALMWGQARVTATEAAVMLAFEPVAASLTAILLRR